MRIIAISLIAGLAGPVVAGETPWQDIAPGSRARLITSDVAASDGTTVIGLEIDMPETTNTYWRVPGETGIPTVFDFTGSRGVAGHEVLWPYPTVETKSGYVDFVYRGATVLPVELRLEGADADLEVAVIMGVCSDICVPVSLTFSLALGLGEPDPAQQLRLTQAVAETPMPWSSPTDPIAWIGYDVAAGALAIKLNDATIDPLSLIADTGNGGQLFGAPQKSPDGKLVHLPFIGGEGSRGVEGKPVRLTFMTTMGPFTLERRIASAGSTAAGD